jgi:inorganic pyrophosphatase/exopolyphosphatase
MSEFFFSKSTKIYVAKKPLKIDSRVKIAAERSNINLKWDDEGRINFIDFDDSKKLLASLGSVMLSPIEYWQVLRDAEEANDKEMIESLTSSTFCEWLDRVYIKEGTFIDHPSILSKYNYSGHKLKSNEPHGRPGWFNPENNVNYDLGLPISIKLSREKFDVSWKYWSPDFSVTNLDALAPIRGYVTSVGKPSLDLGIPVDARQPVQMIRECRRIPLESPIKEEIIFKANEVLAEYGKTKKNISKCLDFVNSYGNLFANVQDISIISIKENLINLLGAIKLDLISAGKDKKVKNVDKAAANLTKIKESELNYDHFSNFIESSRSRLSAALRDKKDIIFTMGHKNPDTDTVVSALFEAWRNYISDTKGIIYIPVVQCNRMPDEIKKILGQEISDSVILTTEEDYQKAKESGLARWISVDQNREPEVQRYFISIIDHHAISEIAKRQEIPKTINVIGSSTALVVQKMLGCRMHFDKKIARILHGATLMDTEDRVKHKMTSKDKVIMNYLKSISEIQDESEFYSESMSALLNTDDSERLFKRDYKEDWGFGFAVAKIKHGFSKSGRVLKPKLFSEAVKLARKNNEHKNFPLTILRITDYEQDNIKVNRERVYLIFNKSSSSVFKKTVKDLIMKIVRFEFGKVNIKSRGEFVEFWGTGMQLSRKKTAPIIEPVVSSFNEFFFSPSNKFWVKRDFLKYSSDVSKAESILKIKTSFDSEKRINWIKYPEAKTLIKKLGFSMLSLSEYWKALRDAKKISDHQMVNSLQGSNFVEFLDSTIINYSSLIDHPNLEQKGKECFLSGKNKKVSLPKASPGLIHPDSIDINTGIPKEVRAPSEYGNPELWRYWAPDADLVIPTRSYIFLLKQPCWDGKFHVEDSFPNLGIRVCCKNIPIPKVSVSFNNKKLTIQIKKEGDIYKYNWAKGEVSGAD